MLTQPSKSKKNQKVVQDRMKYWEIELQFYYSQGAKTPCPR